jgi:hypothetical protein
MADHLMSNALKGPDNSRLPIDSRGLENARLESDRR